mmetsp:Transcript_2743/g.1899  ORF Transcript_2743/g.1899 Transcript_2743/m.1899 type:complete len:81 (+) Transcript_2743:251-493(+)
MMKAICYSKIWVDNVQLQKGDSYNCRILILKLNKEDHRQHTSFVNSIFAAQKLKINIDGIDIRCFSSNEDSSSRAEGSLL